MSNLKTTIVTAEQYQQLWRQHEGGLSWRCLFVSPFWLDTVCRHLGAPGEPHRVAVWQDGSLIGLAPLAIDQGVGHFLGLPSVCDYQDLVVRPGSAGAVAEALLQHLARQGVRRLSLETLHPDAELIKGLQSMAARETFRSMTLEKVDVTYETSLPGTWEDYLLQLDGKQRHEVRRKVRRLETAGPIGFDLAGNNGRLSQAVETFLCLFRLNREDKAEFLTGTMEAYFRDLILALDEQGLLRLYILEVAGQAAATVLCFDHEGVRYLYNSGYDEQFQSLSVGVLCKVFSIREGIEMGCRHYDFLKGAETYKKRIGGQVVELYRCELVL
jgi:CelD/BcsL family acetyltransferase involved in cellulose biosynthesis